MNYYRMDPLEETGLVRTVCSFYPDRVWSYGQAESLTNYRRLGKELGIDCERMVRTRQTHTDVVRVATGKQGGIGVLRDYEDYDTDGCDGLITQERNLLLCTLEADCVPVYLLDPVRKAIAMIHSGWKGTAKGISARALQVMHREFGTDPADVLAAIGPCNCPKCYEVGGELMQPFSVRYSEEEIRRLFAPFGEKYLLNLPLAIRLSLEQEGMRPEQIFDPAFCTYHSFCREQSRQPMFPSFRRDRAQTGRMLTAIMLV